MGFQGYKGIAAVTENIYIVNDDGVHAIRILQVHGGGVCSIRDIAGQRGKQGNDDADVGLNATFDRPSRL